MASAMNRIRETLVSLHKGETVDGVDFSGLYRSKMVDFRKPRESVVRLEHPSNLPRARALGFKAKNGVLVVRVRVRKGSGLHRRPFNGRKPKRMGVNKLTRKVSIQSIAEQRAQAHYVNCEVLNSYWVGEDGKDKYFEVILVDRDSPVVLADKNLSWVKNQKKRVYRGLTSAGKKTRGLRKKGKGTEKTRHRIPSAAARKD